MKKSNLTDDDLKAFEESIKGARRLKQPTKVQFNQKPKPILKKKIELPEEPINFEFSDHLRETIHAEDKLFFARPGLQHKLLRQLRQGQIRQSAALDLHGLTVNEAREELSHFLDHCVNNHYRCVRIIHGKGHLRSLDPPILKNQVNNWLQQYPSVLAFCSAQKRDGGTGALYILLKGQE